MQSRPEVAVGAACVVLFGFMFYKQTMLQGEIKRLRALVEHAEQRRMFEEHAMTVHPQPSLSPPRSPPVEYLENSEYEDDDLPPLESVPESIAPRRQPIPRIETNVTRGETTVKSETQPSTATAMAFFANRADPATELEPIDPETQKKIDQLAATRRASLNK